jgi:hypothetical protein
VPEIAEELGRQRSTIYREVKRNCTPHDGAYRPSMAVEMTNERRSRSRRHARYGLADYMVIEERLREEWSPEQIVGRHRREGLPVMSHEPSTCISGRRRSVGAPCGIACAGRRNRGASATFATTVEDDWRAKR